MNCNTVEEVGQTIQETLIGIIEDASIKRKDNVRTLALLEAGIATEQKKLIINPLVLFGYLTVLLSG